MTEIVSLSVLEIAERIRNRSVSVCEVMQAHLERIDRLNPSINAIVQLDAERAFDAASGVDQRLQAGEDPGPLAGVPFTAKDNLESAGIVTAIGVPARRSVVPQRDATVIARLKAAGGILLGKTNCPPWGGGIETDNQLYGRTNNPHDADRTPGGSSGGEAAAIASGMSACGLGSDSGGSLRYPAHCCGVVTIKPTAGLVPLTGLLDDIGEIGALRDPRTQIGPLARSIGDIAAILSIIAGPDGRDAGAVPVLPGDPGSVDLRGRRVALQFDNGEMSPTPETRRTVEQAANALDDAGMNIVEAGLPDEGFELTRAIWSSYGDEVSSGELYHTLTGWDRYRSSLLNWFTGYNLILRPVDARPAPLRTETDVRSLYTLPFSLTGWPAVALPFGTTEDGLPIAVQIVAHPWQDHVALAAANLLQSSIR